MERGQGNRFCNRRTKIWKWQKHLHWAVCCWARSPGSLHLLHCLHHRSLSSDSMSLPLVAMFSSAWVSEKIASRILNHLRSFTGDVPLSTFIMSVILRHWSFIHLYFTLRFGMDVFIGLCFPFFGRSSSLSFPSSSRASSSFLTCSNICILADFFRAKVSKVRANSLLSSASKMANCFNTILYFKIASTVTNKCSHKEKETQGSPKRTNL